MTEVARAGARVGTLAAVSVAILLRGFLGGDVPVRIEAYDGSVLGPVGARTVLRVRSPDAIRRVLLSPGELGIARAYVAGDLDIDRGTVFDVLELRHTRPDLRLRPADLLAAARLLDLQHDGRGHRPSGQDAHLKQAWWAINHTSVRLEWSPAGYLSRGGRPGPAAWRSGR